MKHLDVCQQTFLVDGREYECTAQRGHPGGHIHITDAELEVGRSDFRIAAASRELCLSQSDQLMSRLYTALNQAVAASHSGQCICVHCELAHQALADYRSYRAQKRGDIHASQG
jgi:hypothetical protein